MDRKALSSKPMYGLPHFFCLLCILLIGFPASAGDGALADIHAALIPFRAIAKTKRHTSDEKWRGATSQLAEVKHKFRDWVEANLKPMDKAGEANALTIRLNNILRQNDFF